MADSRAAVQLEEKKNEGNPRTACKYSKFLFLPNRLNFSVKGEYICTLICLDL